MKNIFIITLCLVSFFAKAQDSLMTSKGEKRDTASLLSAYKSAIQTNITNIGTNTSSLGAKVDTVKLLGTIYNKTSWTDSSDFNTVGIAGTGNLSFTGNKLNFVNGNQAEVTVGSNSSEYNQYISLKNVTNIDKWKMTAKVKCSSISAFSYGFAIGLHSANTIASIKNSAMAFFDMRTAGNGQSGSLVLQTLALYSTAVTPTAITFSQNDYVIISIERYQDEMTITAQKITTNSPISVAKYTFNTTSTGYPLLPNSGSFTIANGGGGFIVDSVNITSTVQYRPSLLLIGDSKFVGYNANYYQSFGARLGLKIKGTVNYSGASDVSQSVVNELPDIINNINPQKVLINIGRNDNAVGIATSVRNQNIIIIDSTLTAAGIPVVWCDGIYETSQSQAVLVNYMDTLTRISARLIKTYVATTAAQNLSGDGIHLTYTGHELLAEIFYTNKLITSGIRLQYIGETPQTTLFPKPDVNTGNINLSGSLNSQGAKIPTGWKAGDFTTQQNWALWSTFATNAAWTASYTPFNNSAASVFTNGYASAYPFQFYTTNGSASLSQYGNFSASGTMTGTQYRLSALNTAPVSSTDTGTLGEIRVTAGFIYICTATNTWVRTALTTF